jgi:hypothetical protein
MISVLRQPVRPAASPVILGGFARVGRKFRANCRRRVTVPLVGVLSPLGTPAGGGRERSRHRRPIRHASRRGRHMRRFMLPTMRSYQNCGLFLMYWHAGCIRHARVSRSTLQTSSGRRYHDEILSLRLYGLAFGQSASPHGAVRRACNVADGASESEEGDAMRLLSFQNSSIPSSFA